MSRNQAQDKKKILDKLHKMPIVEVACKQIGLPRATYYRWRKDDEAFTEACDEALEQSTGMISDMAESQLINAIKEKNMTAIVFWLKHHHPMYETRLRFNGSIKHEVEALSEEQEQLVAKALSMVGLLENASGDNSEWQYDFHKWIWVGKDEKATASAIGGDRPKLLLVLSSLL